jgi:hypothetical protein
VTGIDPRPAGLLLVELGEAVADAAADDRSEHGALAATVLALERLAGASLGGAAGDPPVVLARRFARADRRLLAESDRIAGRETQLRELLSTLRGQKAAEDLDGRRASGGSTIDRADLLVGAAR